MDVVANNLANLETSGFKASSQIFEEYLMPNADATDSLPADRDVSFVIDTGTLQDLSAGPTRQTGNPLDMAIDGEGWFAVQTPDGERYTRNGAFQLNRDGDLVTTEGFQVLGDGGPISFDDRDGAIAIGSDGTISTEAGEKGRIRIAEFATEVLLEPEGSSTFSSPVPPRTSDTARVRQGMLEGSNVKPIVEMTRMIEVTRAYTSLSNILEKVEDMRRNAVGILATVE